MEISILIEACFLMKGNRHCVRVHGRSSGMSRRLTLTGWKRVSGDSLDIEVGYSPGGRYGINNQGVETEAVTGDFRWE
jgi:hypothetical protein